MARQDKIFNIKTPPPPGLIPDGPHGNTPPPEVAAAFAELADKAPASPQEAIQILRKHLGDRVTMMDLTQYQPTHIGEATVVKGLTEDGNWELKDTVPLGKKIKVDLDSIRTMQWANQHEPGETFTCQAILAWEDATQVWAPFPLELLQLENQEEEPH